MVQSNTHGGRARVQVHPSAWTRLLILKVASMTAARLRVAPSWLRLLQVTTSPQETTEANRASRSESVLRKVLERSGTPTGPTTSSERLLKVGTGDQEESASFHPAADISKTAFHFLH